LGTMKSIDTKSLIIGALLASTIFLGVAATSPTDKWDNEQFWLIKTEPTTLTGEKGAEPFAATDKKVFWRKRIK